MLGGEMGSIEFCTNESVSLEKRIDETTKPRVTKPENFDFAYEIDRCARWVRENDFKKVCLQFPDYMLPDSTEVARRLQESLRQTVYVMADTAYESCCVDYVAAAHVNADAVIHFGPVCFSKPTGSLPYLNIYEKESLDVPAVTSAFLAEPFGEENIVVILLDTLYALYADEIKESLEHYPNVAVHLVNDEGLNLRSAVVLFVGGNKRKIINLKFSFMPKDLFFYDPKTEKARFVNCEQDVRIARRRYFLAEKIKDSQTIGIVIGTLAVKNYLRVIDRVKKLIQAHGKKYYVISVGKPTVSKLANFPELDLYVMICCAMSEIYENHDFFKPVVTPYDMEFALNPYAGELGFAYDFNTFLPERELNLQALEWVVANEAEADVSLVTGRIRGGQEWREGGGGDRVAVRDAGTVAVGTNYGAGFLAQRSWKGLEQNLGEDRAQLAMEGRRGVAQGYASEKS